MVSTMNAFVRIARSSPVAATFGVVGSSLLVGWSMFAFVEQKKDIPCADKLMTLEEARLRAMIEDAQASDWRANLNNAATAQEHFMLPGRNNKAPDFMKRIDKRSREMMKYQHEKVYSHQEKYAEE